jgi:hypothetical protein
LVVSCEGKKLKTKTMDTGIAQIIIDAFEENPPVPTSTDDWRDDAEEIMMYLTALKYMESHG